MYRKSSQMSSQQGLARQHSFRLSRSRILVTTTYPAIVEKKKKSSHRHYTNEGTWLCSMKNLFMRLKLESCIISPKRWNSVFFFPLKLENVTIVVRYRKTKFDLWVCGLPITVLKEQCAASHSLPYWKGMQQSEAGAPPSSGMMLS